jgi:hypothetical protein
MSLSKTVQTIPRSLLNARGVATACRVVQWMAVQVGLSCKGEGRMNSNMVGMGSLAGLAIIAALGCFAFH